MTPREVWRDLEARRYRARQEREQLVWMAWHTAVWMRSKKLPSLNEALGRKQTRKLNEEEAVERAAEHDEMTARLLHNVGRKPG